MITIDVIGIINKYSRNFVFTFSLLITIFFTRRKYSNPIKLINDIVAKHSSTMVKFNSLNFNSIEKIKLKLLKDSTFLNYSEIKYLSLGLRGI